MRHQVLKFLAAGLAISVGLPGLAVAATAGAKAIIPQNVFPQKAMPGHTAVAIINGERLSEKKFVDSLLLLNGMTLMQKWFQLTLLKQACEKEGLKVGPAQIQAQLNGVLANIGAQKVPANQRMAALNRILAQRGESFAIFELGLARVAYIMALAKGHVHVTAKQLKLAYERNFGPKVLVRDIVVSSFSTAATVRDLLQVKHDNPAIVARQYSINRQTAADGGLVAIPLKDTTIPRIFRSTAAHLRMGHLSSGIPMGADIHLLWLVKNIPAKKVAFSSVKAALKTKLLQVMELQWGQRELQRLVVQAKIKVKDPLLAAMYAELQKEVAMERQAMMRAKKSGAGTIGGE